MSSNNPAGCPAQPTCGSQGESTDDVGKILLTLFGIVGTIIGIVSTAASSSAVSTLPILGITAQGIGSIGLGAAAGAGAVILTSISFLWDRCLSNPDGLANSCSAGVVDDVHLAFQDNSDILFPFTAQHNWVAVVLKCIYWPLVEKDAQYIYCLREDSPRMFCLYYTDAVCAAEWGSTIGAVVGGVGGIVLGIIAGAALGCAGAGFFYIFCLLIAALIAAIIAAVCALVGAYVGGNIGRVAAGASEPAADGGNAVRTGDYITTKGKTIISGDFEHARIYWFVEHTTLHGHSADPGPFYSHTDPDANLNPDACGVQPGGSPTGGGDIR